VLRAGPGAPGRALACDVTERRLRQREWPTVAGTGSLGWRSISDHMPDKHVTRDIRSPRKCDEPSLFAVLNWIVQLKARLPPR